MERIHAVRVHQTRQTLPVRFGRRLRLVRATPDRFELVDEREVAQSSAWGHVAVIGDGVYVRGLEAISAFAWSDTPGQVARTQ